MPLYVIPEISRNEKYISTTLYDDSNLLLLEEVVNLLMNYYG
jgi:hypothetical protein